MEEYGTDDSWVDTKCKLQDCFIRSYEVSQLLKNVHAKPHLLYGVARRFRMIQFSYLRIIEIASPDRKEPLQSEERNELSIHLNSIYIHIHIHGVLDNLAWAFCHETKVMGEVSELNEKDIKTRKQVGLFTKTFNEALKDKSESLAKSLENFKVWFKELKELRDPIAHRLPLYAPPSILSEDEAQEYNEKNQEQFRVLNELKLDEAGVLNEELGQMGTYMPVFHQQQQHNSRTFSIIIQIEQDIASLNCLATAVLDSLKEKINCNSPIG